MRVQFANLRHQTSPRAAAAGRHAARLFSVTRQGALATGRRAVGSPVVDPARRLVALCCGSTLIGLGVAFFARSELGFPPYDVLLSAVARLLDLSHGQAAWLTSGLLMTVAAFLGRAPSRWSLAMVITNGAAVDTFAHLIVTPDSLAARAGFVGIGMASLAAGISLIVHSGATGGAFELLMCAAEDRGMSATRTRTGLEIGVIAIGVLAGGVFGPATLVMAIAIGPMLGATVQALSDHRTGRDLRLAALAQLDAEAATDAEASDDAGVENASAEGEPRESVTQG